jgi:uncharacterized membrane protein YhaH (DUF805 family)
MSYSFVNAAVIALRYRDPPRNGHYQRSESEKYAWLYLVSAFVFALSLGYKWNEGVMLLSGSITFICFLILCFTKQPNRPENTF